MNARTFAAFAWDVTMAMLAWAAAFWLLFDFEIPDTVASTMTQRLPAVVAVHALVFFAFGLQRGLWRYAGVLELRRIVLAVAAAAVAIPLLLRLLRQAEGVPGPVYVLAPVLLALLVSGSRLAWRAWNERPGTGTSRHADRKPILVVGAGEAAVRLLRDLEESDEWRAVGLLDDNPAKIGGAIRGIKVLGPVANAEAAARRTGASLAVIAMPGVSREARGHAVEICTQAGLRVMTVPAHEDIVSGRVSISTLRAVELDDLLGRDPVKLDDAGLTGLIGGLRVLVTGAGGSIGAELCRQIARYGPGELILFDLSEFALYSIEQEFRDRLPGLRISAVIGDAKSPARVGTLFERFRPQVVFHAAAYKHVPLMETENAFEAVANNALSTAVVARAALAVGAKKFVLVSTDKAVNPTSVMGASKRLAELLCQALQAGGDTQFVIVRFGNVLGSAGSVIPRFREQIARGGPVTVTHEEVERYFMSIPEAAQLVLQAALMGRSGEIYLLDMGAPVKIVDLARQLIRLSGLAENEMPIVFTGLRPGEKLSEELLADAEHSLSTSHPKLRVATLQAQQSGDLVAEVLAWLEAPADTQADAVRARLRSWIPEYRSAPAEDPQPRP